ncbi:PLP-dependent cysteine synthase family protein [Chloroflexota bacterium]
MKIYDNILQAIGNTPMVRLNRVTKGVEADILAKCEFVNPSGSLKDRIALRMIEEAEKAGKLREGGVVTESSTGNTAIALSFVCAAKGYKSIMHMPKGWVTEDRLQILKAYGAEVIEVAVGEEIEKELEGKAVHGGVVEVMPRIKALEMETKNDNVWWARQALNPDNVNAHQDGTAQEIIEQTDGKIDVFIAAVGTGGTLSGVSKALKKVNPAVKIYAVEPEGQSLFKMGPEIRKYMEKYGVPGVEALIVEDMREKGIVDEVFLVNDEDARAMGHRLCEEEGLFCGMSSGANVHVALQVAKDLDKDKTIVTVLADNRYRYLAVEHFTT